MSTFLPSLAKSITEVNPLMPDPMIITSYLLLAYSLRQPDHFFNIISFQLIWKFRIDGWDFNQLLD